jgi:signal transduction histidine kinase
MNISGGDLSPHTPVESNISELDRLGETFQSMTTSLRQSDETKKAFIADVTHELRTPLTVIKGTIETLEDGALDDHEGRGPLLASMQRETDRLIRLVNELLVLTRADARSLQLEMQPLELGELAKQRCEVLSDLAGRQDVKLTVEDETGGNALVLADPDRLSQVLDNLLENAIRHSPKNSTITVSVKEENARVLCAVSDEGDGIPPEHLPFIFERFYRVDKARDRHRGGTGLGLAITQALVRAQRGTITAQSVVGKGTTIRFQLPRTPTSGPKGMLRKDVGVQD